MKEQIQQLIEQHKIYKEEARCEMGECFGDTIDTTKLSKEIEMRTLFISELQELLSF